MRLEEISKRWMTYRTSTPFAFYGGDRRAQGGVCHHQVRRDGSVVYRRYINVIVLDSGNRCEDASTREVVDARNIAWDC